MPCVGFRPQILMIGLLGLALLLNMMGEANGSDWYPTTPTTNDGDKWRIGYYEGGPYINYPANLKAIVKGLLNLGWIDKTMALNPTDAGDSRAVWKALSKAKSNYLTFDPQSYYTANWDSKLREQNRSTLIKKLQNKQVDFIIAMGTWAGQDLANNHHSVPVMVVSASDPVKSGIVKSASYSGFNHVHARCDPFRYIRQIRLFHDIIGFKRLGIVYENSKEGRIYAAIDDIRLVADQRGFDLVTCEAPWSGTPKHVSFQRLKQCHRQLADRIDALYLTVHQGVDLETIDDSLAPLIHHKIPIWSQRGPQEVRHGVLLSISRGGFQPIGMYHAKMMAKILNGASPGELNQIFEDPKKIAINLKTAKEIGFVPPKGLMKVADEIYE
ncbi:MAG: ABC transporter substrate-binding protein [Desulfatitalea sp.]|nr:ABC transporter substrate-binding protein [Desulfatitalea sp.]NNK02617.1 ABC transporter substrate-binding protein [Desulfatitalea sp.]